MAIGTKTLAPSELDTFEDQRLVEELRKAKEELFNLRFQSATGQLESHGRIRAVKRGGKVRIAIFPDRSITKKPLETRMGSGKGSPDHWVAAVKPGRVLFEVSGVSEELARGALTRAIHKLPLKARIIKREEGDA